MLCGSTLFHELVRLCVDDAGEDLSWIATLYEFELRGFYVKKMFVGGLPLESTEETVTEMFNEYGKVRSIKLASDVFTGKCKGFGFIEMEGHEARAAIAGLNGKIIGDKSLKVQFEEPRKGGKRGGRRR